MNKPCPSCWVCCHRIIRQKKWLVLSSCFTTRACVRQALRSVLLLPFEVSKTTEAKQQNLDFMRHENLIRNFLKAFKRQAAVAQQRSPTEEEARTAAAPPARPGGAGPVRALRAWAEVISGFCLVQAYGDRSFVQLTFIKTARWESSQALSIVVMTHVHSTGQGSRQGAGITGPWCGHIAREPQTQPKTLSGSLLRFLFFLVLVPQVFLKGNTRGQLFSSPSSLPCFCSLGGLGGTGRGRGHGEGQAMSPYLKPSWLDS